MKQITLLIILLPFVVLSQGKINKKFPFNEVLLSVNKTPNYAEGQKGYLGFGAGINRRYRDESTTGFVLGIHYNYSSQYLDGYQNSRAGFHSDIIYSFHSISFPIGWRLKFGKNKKLFIELGGNLDVIPLYQKSYTYTSSSLLNSERTARDFNEKRGGVDLSANFGLGTIVSLNNKDFLIKLDYKIGASNYGESYWPTQPIHNQFTRLSVGYLFNESLNNRLKHFFKDY